MSTSTATAGSWAAPHALGPVEATVSLPGSKSQTNRLLVLAALAETQSTLRRPLRARDTQLMTDALRALGTEVTDHDGDLVVVPRALVGPASIDCGLAGNVMRFVPAIAGLATGRIHFDGDERARERPIAPLLDALADLGVTVRSAEGGRLPFSVEGRGHVRGGEATIDSSASSQFVSALLLAGCRYDDGLLLKSATRHVPSMPHIRMTLAMLGRAGVFVDQLDGPAWRVPSAVPVVHDVTVEPDLSNALPFFAAALMTGGRCLVPHWPADSLQPVDVVKSLIEAFGGTVSLAPGGLTVEAGRGLQGVDLDMRDVGELVPTVTALAAFASSPSVIRGVAHLRGHETDRLAALAGEFTALGGDVTETADGLRIQPRPLRAGTFHTYDDHRMATAGALVGLAVPGTLVENVATTEKTLPDFTGLWQQMLGDAAA